MNRLQTLVWSAVVVAVVATGCRTETVIDVADQAEPSVERVPVSDVEPTAAPGIAEPTPTTIPTPPPATPIPTETVPPTPETDLSAVFVPLGEPIQLRTLTSLTPEFLFIGGPTQIAVELAVRDFGPILGYDVAVDTVEDRCSQTGGTSAAADIIGEGEVVGVIGATCSEASLSAIRLLSGRNIVTISPASAAPALTADHNGAAGFGWSPGFYRVAQNDMHQGIALADFLETQGITSAAVVTDTNPYVRSLAIAFADTFEAFGGQVSLHEFAAASPDEVLTEVIAQNPEALFMPLDFADATALASARTDAGALPDVQLYLRDGILTNEFILSDEAQGTSAVIAPFQFPPTNSNQSTGKTGAQVAFAVRAAYAELEDPFGPELATAYWAHAYDATTLMLEAISSAATVESGYLAIDRSGIVAFLDEVSGYRGLTGTLTCDEWGDCGSQTIQVLELGDSGSVYDRIDDDNIVFEYSAATRREPEQADDE